MSAGGADALNRETYEAIASAYAGRSLQPSAFLREALQEHLAAGTTFEDVVAAARLHPRS